MQQDSASYYTARGVPLPAAFGPLLLALAGVGGLQAGRLCAWPDLTEVCLLRVSSRRLSAGFSFCVLKAAMLSAPGVSHPRTPVGYFGKEERGGRHRAGMCRAGWRVLSGRRAVRVWRRGRGQSGARGSPGWRAVRGSAQGPRRGGRGRTGGGFRFWRARISPDCARCGPKRRAVRRFRLR